MPIIYINYPRPPNNFFKSKTTSLGESKLSALIALYVSTALWHCIMITA